METCKSARAAAARDIKYHKDEIKNTERELESRLELLKQYGGLMGRDEALRHLGCSRQRLGVLLKAGRFRMHGERISWADVKAYRGVSNRGHSVGCTCKRCRG